MPPNGKMVTRGKQRTPETTKTPIQAFKTQTILQPYGSIDRKVFVSACEKILESTKTERSCSLSLFRLFRKNLLIWIICNVCCPSEIQCQNWFKVRPGKQMPTAVMHQFPFFTYALSLTTGCSLFRGKHAKELQHTSLRISSDPGSVMSCTGGFVHTPVSSLVFMVSICCLLFVFREFCLFCLSGSHFWFFLFSVFLVFNIFQSQI